MSRLASIGTVTVLAALAALATGCDDKKTDTTATDASAPLATGATASGTAVAAAGDEPSEADFEEEAERSITASNLEAEIAKMEAELK